MTRIATATDFTYVPLALEFLANFEVNFRVTVPYVKFQLCGNFIKIKVETFGRCFGLDPDPTKPPKTKRTNDEREEREARSRFWRTISRIDEEFDDHSNVTGIRNPIVYLMARVFSNSHFICWNTAYYVNNINLSLIRDMTLSQPLSLNIAAALA